jgi:hypothetical protein
MTDTTAPSGSVASGPMSFDEGASAIENLISDVPEEDSIEGAQATESKPEDSVTDDDELTLSLDDEDVDGSEDQANAPKTAADDMLVTMDDGTTISVADLKTNSMFQRTFTRKTEELKQERIALEQEHQRRVAEAESELSQRRELVLEMASRFLPQEPSLELLQTDPIGYFEAKALHDEQMKKLTALDQQRRAEFEAGQARQTQEFQETKAREWDQFLTVLPKLKDTAKLEAFRKDVKDIGIAEYKLAPEELQAIVDHRYMRVLHDAIAYRKLVAKSKTVQQEVSTKPKLVQKQRMAPQAIQTRDQQGRFEQLRQTGSIDAAARAIESLL